MFRQRQVCLHFQVSPSVFHVAGRFRQIAAKARADHYHAHHNALVWDLIEESPLFADEVRLFVTNQLLDHARSAESGGGLGALSGGADAIFDRHAGFIGLCALSEGRYLARDYPSPEWTKILAAVDAYFKPHLGSFASGSDLARGIYTYLEALLIYSLLTDDEEIVRSGALRAWADRCVAMCDPLGFLVPSGQYDEMSYPYFTLRKAAYLLADPGLLYAAEMRRRAGETQGVYGLGMEYDQGQAFAGDIAPRPPLNLAGVHVVPLDSRERRAFDPALPQEKAFAKVTFRTGFGRDDQFLLLDGIWGGPPGKPIQDAGAILQFTDGGRTFIVNVDPETKNRRSSYVNHNVLSVTRNGEAPEPPRLASLEGAADLPSMGYAHARLAPYMNGGWNRHILWRKGSYFLVRDVFRAARAGVFALESQWRLLGRVEIEEGGFTGILGGPGLSETNERTLMVRTAGGPAGRTALSGWPVRRFQVDMSGETVSRQYARYAPPAINRLRPTAVLRLEEGEKEEFCALLFTTSGERPRRHSLVALGKNVYLIPGDEPAWAGFPESGGEFVRGPLAVKARAIWATAATVAAHGLTRLEIGGQPVLSAAKPIDAEWDLARGTCTLRLDEPTAVEIATRVRVELEPGKHRFSDMKPVDQETMYRLARTLAQDEAIPGPGTEPPVDEALRPALSAPLPPPAGDLLPGAEIHDLEIKEDGTVLLAGLEILASQSNIFSFDAGGAMESADAFPSGREGWDYTGVSALAASEIKDGRVVLAVARSGAYNEVAFYNASTGRALGKTGVGDTISGLTWLEVNHEQAVVAATEAGWVIALRPDGQAVWSVPLPDSAIRLWALSGGRVAAYCRNRDYFILDSAGRILSRGQGSWPAAMVRTILD